MAFTILLFVSRNPTLTPAEFMNYWDNNHVKLLKSIAGDKFPITHTRRYIARAENNKAWPASVLLGTQDDFTYDGIAELTFSDEAAFQSFYTLFTEPETAAKIAADEEVFAVRETLKAVVLGEVSVTTKE